MPFPPSCFIIGAQKSGTTSLATLLDAQEGLCVSTPKEPQFFSKNYHLGIDWYRSCFPEPDNTILIDASPDYTRGPTDLYPVESSYDSADFQQIPKRIHELKPDAKLLYMLRNPIDRTHSSYWHNVRAGYEKEEFSHLIRTSDRYLVASDYIGQVNNYLEYFTLDQFHFVIFEEFVRAPGATVRKICSFLGTDYTAIENTDNTQRNASYQLNGLAKLVRKGAGSNKNFEHLSRILKGVLPDKAQQLVLRLTTQSIPNISDSDASYLRTLFKDRNAQLSELTGLNLEIWNQ